MKKYILIASTLIIAFAAKAQVNDIPIIGNKFTFGIDGGLALSGTDSRSVSDISSSSFAYTKTGYCYDGYAGFKFSKFIGIMAQYGTNINSMNASDIVVGTVSGGYKVNEYLVGPYFSITLIKIKIEVKLLAGMVSSNCPTFTSNQLGPGYYTYVVDSYSSGSAFGYCAGVKIKYMMIGGLLGIGVGLNNVVTDENFKGTSTEFDPAGKQLSSSSINNKVGITIIQPTLGLSLDI